MLRRHWWISFSRTPSRKQLFNLICVPFSIFSNVPKPPCLQGTGRSKCFCRLCRFLHFCRLQSLSGDPASAADPCRRNPLFTSPPHFSRFFSFFLPIKNSSKIWPLSNPPKTSKIGPLNAQSSILEPFWLPFGIPFPIIFLIFSQNAKTLFLNNSIVL